MAGMKDSYDRRNGASGGSGFRLAIALPVSLAIHVLIGLALIRGGVDPARMAAAADPAQLEIPIKLGIERSNAASVQAATTEAVQEARAVLEAFRAEFAKAIEEAAQAQPEPQPEPTPEAPQQPEPSPQQPAEPTPAEDRDQDGSPGQQDTRVSPATSLPVEMRRTELGKVVAGEGLKINTTRMRLTTLQRMSGRAPSPLVEIFFQHDGTVARARIPRGRGSGRSDLDNSLINSIYEWTATGERIDALEEDDPPLLIRMRILF